MTWLVFGAGGAGVGALTLQCGLTEKIPQVALVRQDKAATRLRAQGVRVVMGDACNQQKVLEACQAAGPGALIISTLGGENDYLANQNIVDSAEQSGIRRMILVISLGCGDTWPWLSSRARAAFGQAVREKSLAECWLQSSSLDFAILRPGGLLNGPATGKAVRTQNQETHGLVMRADVAAHIQQLAHQPSLNGQIYCLVEPGLAPA